MHPVLMTLRFFISTVDLIPAENFHYSRHPYAFDLKKMALLGMSLKLLIKYLRNIYPVPPG
jgi:hypothetical protein